VPALAPLPAEGEQGVHPGHEVREGEGLPEVIPGPAPEGIDGDVFRALPRHEEDRSGGEEPLDEREEIGPEQVGQAVIEEDQLERRLPWPSYLTITPGSQVMIPGNAMKRSNASTMSRMYGITPRMIIVVLMPKWSGMTPLSRKIAGA
jgi:hypothetical protein